MLALQFLYKETLVSLLGNCSFYREKLSFPCLETVVPRLETGVSAQGTNIWIYGTSVMSGEKEFFI